MCKFRDLKADEIDVRVQSVKQNGIILLLYKDARVDMNILDETVGSLNWQKEYRRDNQNCVVSIWDESKKQWISKEDTGTESNTEKEKGLASDSFKRACFNWGIGRELYTSPFIWVSMDKCNIVSKNNTYGCADKFIVSKIEIENKQITHLEIENASTKKQCFKWDKKEAPKKEDKPAAEAPKRMSIDEALETKVNGVPVRQIFKENRGNIQQIYNACTPIQREAFEVVQAFINQSKTSKNQTQGA